MEGQPPTQHQLMPHLRRRDAIRHHYRIHFADAWRERLFISSASFTLTFATIRGITHMIRSGRGPVKNLAMGSTHIHHLVWGILLLHVVGYAGVAGLEYMLPRKWVGRLTAAGYGAGAAMTLDEFALWLRLEDVYWSQEGRLSVDAVVLFGAVLSTGLWGGRFIQIAVRELLLLRQYEAKHLHGYPQNGAPDPAAAG
jgi:hypothetical protein